MQHNTDTDIVNCDDENTRCKITFLIPFQKREDHTYKDGGGGAMVWGCFATSGWFAIIDGMSSSVFLKENVWHLDCDFKFTCSFVMNQDNNYEIHQQVHIAKRKEV